MGSTLCIKQHRFGSSDGRVLIRYSGTEPLLRIMIEGADKYQITGWAKDIAESVEKAIGEK